MGVAEGGGELEEGGVEVSCAHLLKAEDVGIDAGEDREEGGVFGGFGVLDTEVDVVSGDADVIAVERGDE